MRWSPLAAHRGWPFVARRRAGSGTSAQACATASLGLVAGLALLISACATANGTTGIAGTSIVQTGAWSAHTLAPPVPVRLSVDQVAEQMVAHMSLDDRIGQMIIMQFTEQGYTPAQAAMIKPYHPGGAILYSYAMGSGDQVKALLAGAQHDSPIPMLTMTDLEGGWIDHLAPYVGYHMSAPEMAATGNPAVATAQGAKVAHDLLSFGFNTDLAPVVDVELVAGPDQVGRDFGSTPDPVITYAGAFETGLATNGVAGTLKHFPGLGDATTDAHVDLPVINRSRAQLEATELAPYRALIAQGKAPLIMSTDVLMPALDPVMPAEISRPIITGVLRNELHFQGVAITDALYMAGIQDKYYFVEAAVMAIEAGNDMIMAPFTPGMIAGVIASTKAAIASGALSLQQVNDSVERILALKLRYHILPMPRPMLPGSVGGPPVGGLSAEMPRSSVTGV
jgi:beta-N-acetylhexosaminidase